MSDGKVQGFKITKKVEGEIMDEIAVMDCVEH